MSYELYKVIHVIALAALILSFGLGFAYFAAPSAHKKALRAWVFSLHGLGLAALLVTGFGMLARMGMTSSFPGWAIGKIVIWIVLALLISVVKRKASWFPGTAVLILALVGLAASFAIMKPF